MTGRDPSPRSSAAGAGAESLQSAGSGIHQTGQAGVARSSSSRLRSSAITSAGAAAAMRSRRSLARSCSGHDAGTAPMRKQASMARTHSERLPIQTSTTSPRPTPAALRRPAKRADASATSPNVHVRRAPSRVSSISAAVFAGAASMTSPCEVHRGRASDAGAVIAASDGDDATAPSAAASASARSAGSARRALATELGQHGRIRERIARAARRVRQQAVELGTGARDHPGAAAEA